MSVLTIAKNMEEVCGRETDARYVSKRDLGNLLFYAYNKRSTMVLKNLYNIGIESIYSQFLYLQNRRVKPLNTRALHYILSFDTQRNEREVDYSLLVNIMYLIQAECFQEYQCIQFLHMDKPSHYHIHLIINPVNINDLSVCRENIITVGRNLAEWLGIMYNIPLQSFTYRNETGRVVWGNETGAYLYKDKFLKKYNLKPVR